MYFILKNDFPHILDPYVENNVFTFCQIYEYESCSDETDGYMEFDSEAEMIKWISKYVPISNMLCLFSIPTMDILIYCIWKIVPKGI